MGTAGEYSISRSTTAPAYEPVVANLEASKFGSLKKSQRSEAVEVSKWTRTNGFPDTAASVSDEQRAHTSPFHSTYQAARDESISKILRPHPEEAELMLNTMARNAMFKINMPHSQARMPEYLARDQIRPKPFVPQRRHVHSFIYPSKFEMLRHEMKRNLRDKLVYSNPAKL